MDYNMLRPNVGKLPYDLNSPMDQFSQSWIVLCKLNKDELGP